MHSYTWRGKGEAQQSGAMAGHGTAKHSKAKAARSEALHSKGIDNKTKKKER
jgi:hypothetical protein